MQESEDQMDKNQNEQGAGGGVNYAQDDPLAAIGYSAQPGDIYYMNPPKELSTYPMYIDNPKKIDKTVGSYVSYTMEGTDFTEQLSRRYSDFFSLYEKLLQRWPGIYIPRIPPKKITGNTDTTTIKTRIRLLNRFCLNLSNIEYLYKAEETNIFKSNIADVSNAINKLPELNLSEILARMKEAFPEYNGNYDMIVGKSKISDFEQFLKKCQKNIGEFEVSVNNANEKRETEKKQFLEMIKNFSNYENENIKTYAENENALIFSNPSFNTNLTEKINKLKGELINPFVAFKNWLEEETLDVEAMLLAIKQIYQLLDNEEKLKEKLNQLEEELKAGQAGQVGFFKGLFKKKEDIIAEIEKEKEVTQQKINDIQTIIRIVGDNMENQIEVFKSDKTQNYYKYLKMFAILQRESNKVTREFWTLVKGALNDVSPNAGQDEEYQSPPQPIYEPSQEAHNQEYGEGGEGGEEGEGGEAPEE